MSGTNPDPRARIAGSLVEVLLGRAAEHPTRIACRFLANGANETLALDYAGVDRRARALAALLAEEGAAGERALLLLDPGPSYVSAFLGCFYAGVVPVPVYPPAGGRATERVHRIGEDAGARFALASRAARDRMTGDPEWPLRQVRWIVEDEFDRADPSAWRPRFPAPGDLAFLQYTSGSTSQPKGVMVTHDNLVAHAEIVRARTGVRESDVLVSWLPPYHDMGLIGFILQPLFVGCTTVLMSPLAFVRRPLRWLEAIARFRATMTGAPDFGYASCADAAADAPPDLDLSSWRLAMNGAEPVRHATLERFARAFAPAGFDPSVFMPCYGLAEATLCATSAERGRGARTLAVDPVELERGRVHPAATAGARAIVSSGTVGDTPRVAIVKPEERRPCPPGEVGEIWLAGPSIGRGYWRDSERTEATFRARLDGDPETTWLRTGDLGFLSGGELYVTGRIKDLVIIRGRNLYPHDIEATAAASHPALGAGVAVAVDHGDEERLVVIQEIRQELRQATGGEAILDAIRRAVLDEHGALPHTIALIRRGGLPRTSSGKLMRYAARAAFLAGDLRTVAAWTAPEPDPSALPPDLDGEPPGLDGEPAASNGSGSPAAGNGDGSAGRTAAELRRWMVRAVAHACGTALAEVAVDAPWSAHGLDSPRLTRLAGQLGDWLGRELSPALFYDHPSIGALAEFLATGARPAMPEGRPRRDAGDAPIAIVGLACRFPGADDADRFFALLRAGRHAIREVPADRPSADAWRRAAEAAPATRWAGWLDEVDTFDAALFGVSRREARALDPQQRLLLETAWRAFEDAGCPQPALAGSATGVFVGISNGDYARLLAAAGASADPYAGTGNALSVAANRISYCFDLRGPSVAIDSACSSSLVAVHQACASLRAGECDRALAGGVNLLLAPDLSIVFAGAGMLSPDGLPRAFDTGANGYVRGEGCGLVVLRRLADATADGDRILAVLRGTAVNQDGRSNGLTAPNGLSQRAVIRAALAQAGVEPADVDYIEAHGTGTALGDPIELTALRAVFCDDALRQGPLAVGSVKGNIGHLESAAGIAGLLKVVLSLVHGELPPHLHATTPIGLAEPSAALELCASARPWPAGRRRLAGVSSFGFGGTNAHIVVEGAPAAPAASTVDTTRATSRSSSSAEADTPAASPALPLLLSARDDAALRRHARQVAAHLASADTPAFAETCRAAAAERTPLPARLAVVAADPAGAERALVAWSEGAQPAAMATRTLAPGEQPPRIAWLFSGQGSQYDGMACVLYQREPIFRRWIDRCDAALAGRLGIGLIQLLSGADRSKPLAHTRYTQPALFAVEVALAQTLLAWGIRPTSLLGHSVGEFAAACVAGVFDLEEGLRLIAARGELVQELPAGGAMLAVSAAPERAEAMIAEASRGATATGIDSAPRAGAAGAARPPAAVVAAINGPERTVLSGPREHLERVAAACAAAGIAARFLDVSHAFHSPLLAPIADRFGEVAAPIAFRAPTLELLSNVTGASIGAAVAEPGYWVRHLLEPVRFAAGVQSLFAGESPPGVVIEIGPGAALLAMAREALSASQADDVAWLPTLRRTMADDDCLAHALGQLHLRNAPVDWRAVLGRPRIRRALPDYPFARDRHWFSAPEGAPAGSTPAATLRGGEAGHPLLGTFLDLPGAREQRFESRLRADAPAWIGDHRVGGAAVLPAAAYVDLALAAAAQRLGEGALELRDLDIAAALLIADDATVLLHTTVAAAPHGCEVQVFSSAGGAPGRWTRHATAQVVPSSPGDVAPLAARSPSPRGIAPLAERSPSPSAAPIDVDSLYDALARRGLEYGPAFRGLQAIARGDGELRAEIRLPETQPGRDGAHAVSPRLLDAALQAVAPLFADESAALLPVGVERLHWRPAPEGQGDAVIRVHARRAPTAGRDRRVDLDLVAASGTLWIALRGLRLRPFEAAAPGDGRVSLDDARYVVDWTRRGQPGGRQPRLPSPGAPAAVLGAELTRRLGDDEIAAYLRHLAELEERAAFHARSALAALGFDRGVDHDLDREIDRDLGTRRTRPASRDPGEAARLAERLGVVPAHRRLFRRLLEISEARAAPVETTLGSPSAGGGAGRSHAAIVRSVPGGAATPEAALLERCAARLVDVLRGRCDALTELLFPGGDGSDLLRVYRDSPGPRLMNDLVGTALEQALASLPEGDALRVLEVGGGTGGTTEGLLRRLVAERTEYVFTDVSPQLVAATRRRLAGSKHEPFAYRALDIERDPASQGLALHGVDVVVATNALHATADLAASLAHIRELLAPGGWLVLLEGTRPLHWLDLTFGLTDGWWRFSDTDRRPDHPLVTADVWRTVLREAGFDEVFSTTEAESGLVQDVILASVPRTARRPRSWFVASTRPGSEGALTRALAASGAAVHRPAPGQRFDRGHLLVAESPGHIEPAAADHRGLRPGPADRGVDPGPAADPPGVILFADPLAETSPTDGAAADAALATAAAALALIQDVLRQSEPPASIEPAGPPELIEVCLVTRGAREIGDGVTAAGLAGAPLWGLARAVRLEHPELRLRCIDLPGRDTDAAWELLARELEAIDPEDEVALRGDGRWVPRLAAAKDATGPTAGSHTPFRIAPELAGHLDSLRPRPLIRRAPGPDEIEIRVRATGLNFRDLLQALGSLGTGYADELSLEHMPFGFECSGVVERIGADVTDLTVGTPVIAAFTPGSLASHVTLPARFAIAKPDALDWAGAAALPTAWLTVWHAFDQLAHLAPGEHVLIHAAAGGVGTAAVRHALSVGADVLATAHPRKWSALRALGVRRIATSRDDSFADQVLAWTGGRGADVVLNALAGQLARRSLEVTAAYGRFVDLGRISGLDETTARTLRPDVAYRAFDLGLMAARRDPAIDASMAKLAERAASLRLDTRAYPLGQAERAFRDLQAGRHIGKLALTQPAVHLDAPPRIRPDATYAITGGTGGLGLRVAAWLADQGATDIALLARQAPGPEARALIATLATRGVTLRTLETDISRRDSLARALTELRAGGRAIRGIIHAAGVLDDALVENLDRDRLRTVFDPKVRGAVHLDELTRGDPLDFFVLFASAAGLLGSPGQANHAAANAFLDALAWHRRATGRPATSLDWGAWSDIGVAARKRAGDRMRLGGLDEIDPDQGIAAFARALTESPVQLGIVPIHWSHFQLQPQAERAFYTRVARTAQAFAAATAVEPVLDLTDLDEEGRRRALDHHLRTHIAAVLGLDSANAVEPRSRLMDLGMDSLMAVELKRRLEHTLGCTLRSTLMYDHPTVEALVAHLGKQLAPEPGDAEPSDPPPSLPALVPALEGLDDIAALSDAEVLERLRR